MTAAKRKTLKTSSLEKIKGIGPAKAKKLMAHFKTLSAVKAASLDELCGVAGIGKSDAQTLYGYFHPQKDSVSAQKTQE